MLGAAASVLILHISVATPAGWLPAAPSSPGLPASPGPA
ncbi:hypothetical protein CVS47_02443 [Microbacterium lemovicicum]|uniref:Uncharacterized protein n=1 Tax=Microbacterium lemovicicum TaxID=1072463 RepID=A0A3Q9J4S3_9MICO|nr:hypothetical protein CVS47_02443 [Microbacterium lemovicicum]